MLEKYEELKNLQAGIYKRKSQESDERQILSIGKQDEICYESVAEYVFQTNPEWDFEEKKSAKTAGVRSEFNRMIELVLNGTIEVVVAWHVNRLARNMQEGGLLIDLLHTGYLKAIVTKDKIYFPNDNTIIIAIELASATEYSRDLSRSVKSGIDRKATLQLPHGRAPLGYRNNTHKRQGERDWSDDPDRLPLLQQVFQRLLTGRESGHAVWKWATEELHLTTPSRQKIGGGLLPLASFYRLLRRTEYAGFFFRNGEKIELSGVTPIISEDEYWQIQDMLGGEGVARPKNQIATYSHFLISPDGEYCGTDRTFRVTCDCGHTFSGRTKKACPRCKTAIDRLKHPRYYSALHYYNVPRKKRKERCKYLNETVIDDFLLTYTKTNLRFTASQQEWSLNYLRELKDKEYQDHQVKVKRASDYIRSLEQQQHNAKRALLAGAFSPSEYKDALRDIYKCKKKAESTETLNHWHDKATALVSFADNLSYIWKAGSVDDKRQMLADIGSNLIWDEKNVSIKNAKWLDRIVTGLNRAKESKRRFELEGVSKISRGSNAKSTSSAELDPTFPILCGMWDDVRTLLREDNA